MDQKKLVNFALLWLATIILLTVITAVFPLNIVMGTASVSKPMAAILNGFILTIVIYFVPSITKKLELKLKSEKADILSYLVADLLVIWGLKKLAHITGLGVSSILFVLILAVLAAIVQFKVLKYGPKLIK